MKRFKWILFSLALIPAMAFTLTAGYDIELKNNLSSPATLRVTQYHSEGFNDARPSQFTKNLSLGSKIVTLPAGSSQIIHYNSASGGFWLVWQLLEPSSNESGGVLNLLEGDHAISIQQ